MIHSCKVTRQSAPYPGDNNDGMDAEVLEQCHRVVVAVQITIDLAKSLREFHMPRLRALTFVGEFE